jgi:putative transposase
VTVIAADHSISIVSICDVLNVSRSAYYTWRDGEESTREKETKAMTPRIAAIFWRHKRRYGAPRIVEELRDERIVTSRRRVGNILKSLGLKAIQPKSFVPKTTASRHTLGYNPNLLIRDTPVSQPGQVWVGDITYLPLPRGAFAYLAALMDLFTRDIVGWHVMNAMEEELVLTVLTKAIRERQPQPGLIHHTDRGGQYAGKQYRAVLKRAAMNQSMSRADNCYDNAFMESCWGSFKTEIQRAEYDSVADAKKEIAEFVRYYRFDRKHSSLGYLTPHQFTQAHSRHQAG